MCNSKGGCGVLGVIAKILVIIGGINWGLIGVGILLGKAGSYNIVGLFLGSLPVVEAIVYVLVGIAALTMIFTCKCKKCENCCPIEEKKEEAVGL